MKDGPDITRIAALIGDPARANILVALLNGKALTVTELAQHAGVTVQTASSHLTKLEDGGLVSPRKAGRHKYFTLSGDAAANVLEQLMGFAASNGQFRTRTGPKDAALRKARVCYNHLAGEAGIRIFESLGARRFLGVNASGLTLTAEGRSFVMELGLNLDELASRRSALCRECLDWSERKSHLAGTLGRALLELFLRRGMMRRLPDSRVVTFVGNGENAFNEIFPLPGIEDRVAASSGVERRHDLVGNVGV